MKENKNLDGIKKLSKDEIKKARRILLDYIGEDSLTKPVKRSVAEKNKKPKSMDGILGGINFKKREKREKREQEKKLNTKKEREALKKELGFTEKKKETEPKELVDTNVGGAFLRMAEKDKKKKERLKARKDAKTREQELEKAVKIEEEKTMRLKAEEDQKRKEIIEEEKKKKEEQKKTSRIKEELEREKRHFAKVKKEEAEKRKREKIEKELELRKEKEKNKKERKKKFRKRIKLFRHRIHKRIATFLKEVREKRQKIILSILLLFMVAILMYLSFAFFLIRVNPDNKVTRFMADLFPVPVLISADGILEYYDYIDKKNTFKSQYGFEEGPNLNKIFAIDFVLNNLVEKYSINQDDEDFEAQIKKGLMFDMDANSVGIKRIQKIKDLIDGGGNFVQVSNKYGDRVDKIDFPSEQKAVEKYGEKLRGLKIDEISDIIVGDDGYYIFKRYMKSNTFSLSYVYISSVSLDDYLNDEATKLKIWSLVD